MIDFLTCIGTFEAKGYGLQQCIGMSFKALLLDIEGTVCPIAFVKDVLFPFFCSKVSVLLQSNDPEVKRLLAQFPAQDNLQEYIQDLVARDVKDPILKQLQGHVWAQGYYNGEIKAPVYKDAIELIKRKPEVYIYSSGSVKAQKLLFGHVEDPSSTKSIDLQPFIKSFFDINTSGKKTEPESYQKILQNIGKQPDDVLFISDNILELDAASQVGLETILAVRPGNPPVTDIKNYTILEDYSTL